VAFVHRCDLVRDVIDQRIGAISVLLDIGNHTTRERRNVIRLPGHLQICTDEVDAEMRPHCRTYRRRHRESDRAGGNRRSDPYVETEPIAKVQRRRAAQVSLGDLPSYVAVDVNVQARPHAKITSQQCGCALDDPTVVDEIEPFEESVVGHLALQLLDRPGAGRGRNLDPI
jgi:hypothetical protein